MARKLEVYESQLYISSSLVAKATKIKELRRGKMNDKTIFPYKIKHDLKTWIFKRELKVKSGERKAVYYRQTGGGGDETIQITLTTALSEGC